MKKPIIKGGVISSVAGIIGLLLVKIPVTAPVLAAFGISVISIESISRYLLIIGVVFVVAALALFRKK